jgi:hypothetical protein
MRPIQIDLIHDSILKSLDEVEDRLSVVTEALSGDRARRAWVAEMSLVSAVTHWESYLTDLLIAQVCHAPSVFVSEFGLPEKSTFVTRPLVEAVFTGLRYLAITGIKTSRGSVTSTSHKSAIPSGK